MIELNFYGSLTPKWVTLISQYLNNLQKRSKNLGLNLKKWNQQILNHAIVKSQTSLKNVESNI